MMGTDGDITTCTSTCICPVFRISSNNVPNLLQLGISELAAKFRQRRKILSAELGVGMTDGLESHAP